MIFENKEILFLSLSCLFLVCACMVIQEANPDEIGEFFEGDIMNIVSF